MIVKYNISLNANLLGSFPKQMRGPVVPVLELTRARLITAWLTSRLQDVPAWSALQTEFWSVVFAARVVTGPGDPKSMAYWLLLSFQVAVL